jgi:HAD superfamily hydrolase (TIGR01450 family)
MSQLQILSGISGLVDTPTSKYNVVLVDVYGVLHDGTNMYPGAYSALCRMKEHIKTILFSNSPRSEAEVAVDLKENYDISSEDYHGIITSGDCARLFLDKCFSSQCSINMFGSSGLRTEVNPNEFAASHISPAGKITYYYLIGPFEIDIEGLEITTDPAKAQFVVVTDITPVSPHDTIDLTCEDAIWAQYYSLLQEFSDRYLPMLCLNPDVISSVSANGTDKNEFRPGYLAWMYNHCFSGVVTYFGKPYAGIYELARFRYNVDVESENNMKCLCIGDNVSTDILGAVNAGFDVVMVTGGVHKAKIMQLTEKYGLSLEEAINIICTRIAADHDVGWLEPKYVIDKLMWG